MKLFFQIVVFWAFFPLAVCSAGQQRNDDLESALQEAFRTIYLSTYGLDYPGSPERVANCIEKKAGDCLDTFNAVMDAKQFIVDQIQLDSERMLRFTLDTIISCDDLARNPENHQVDPVEACGSNPPEPAPLSHSTFLKEKNRTG